MSEKQTNKKTLVDPFTGVKKEVYYCEAPKEGDPNELPILGVELDKETGNTVVVTTGTRDLDKEIQEFKDQCGFEGMAQLIAQGRATPKDFYDDGQHGQDVAGLPDNVHDAYRAAMDTEKTKSNLFKELGVSVVYNKDGSIDIEATEKVLSDAVKARFDSMNIKTEEKENA